MSLTQWFTRSAPPCRGAGGDRDLELRPDAVGRGDQHRLAVPREVGPEEAAEAPDVPRTCALKVDRMADRARASAAAFASMSTPAAA